ncbi:hypothetical protein A2U01_0042442, partial [Trifolium medium]|nr:hypothetical protein [Trifolium medium]
IVPEEEDVETILKRRVKVDNFPIFTQLDPLEVLEDYLRRCKAEGINPLVDPKNLPARPPNTLKRKKKDIKPKETAMAKQEKPSSSSSITTNSATSSLRIKSASKRRKYTIHDLEETSEEKNSSSTEVNLLSNPGKSPALSNNVTISKNLVNPSTTNKELKLGSMAAHYEENMTIKAS